MDNPSEKLDDPERAKRLFLDTFDGHLREAERIANIVKPLTEAIGPFLKTKEILKGTSLTMNEVIDFTVDFFRENWTTVSISISRGITIHDVIDEIAGTLWLLHTMEGYDYLHIDDDPAFTCSRDIKEALERKLEAVGLLKPAN
jgi:hypothetical protein